jgi:hypothetical protein
MLRAFSITFGLLFVAAGLLVADDQSQKDQDLRGQSKDATITNVDQTSNTITVKMKDENGQEKERVFRLTGDIRMLDSDGTIAVIDVFRSGDHVLVIEREGKLSEMRKGSKVNEQKLEEQRPFEQKPLEDRPPQ